MESILGSPSLTAYLMSKGRQKHYSLAATSQFFSRSRLSLCTHSGFPMLSAWQADSGRQETVPLICRDFFREARVDKEGFAQLDLEGIDMPGETRNDALNLEFGKPQAPTVQCSPLSVVPSVSVKHNLLSPLGYQASWSKLPLRRQRPALQQKKVS